MSGSNEQKIIKWIGSFLGVPFVEDFYETYRKNDRINEIVKFLNEHPEYKDYIVNDEKDETKQISDEVKKNFADNAYSDLPLSYEQLLEEKGIEDKAVYRRLYGLLQQDVFNNMRNDFNEYSCAGVPLFRRNGYRQSGGRKPLFRNRDTALT